MLQGIANGFDIIDDDVVVSPVSVKNHPSARPSSKLYGKATEQILTEIELGNYVICDSPPEIVSLIAVIPKTDGGVRLIHDCSRPIGNAVNDYCSTDWKQKFSTVDDAAARMTEGCFFAKVDLKSAYRSVGLSQRSQQVTGLKWQINGQTVYMRDSKLCFGARLSPRIFHRITQAVKRMMAQRGFDLVVVYLDDFLIISQSKIECQIALNVLIQLLRRLGFSIHWGKVVDPTTKITFLGIELDSVAMVLRLPDDKLQSFKQELQGFIHRKRASKRQLQALAGRLSWAAGVVKGGRVFLRRIFNQINVLKHVSHKAKLSKAVIEDPLWWVNFLQTFNRKSALLEAMPIDCVFTDACDDAAGGVFGADWFYTNWTRDIPQAQNLHINEKEVLAVVVAAHRWAPFWANKRIIIRSDNITTVASINKCTSRNDFIMQCLRKLFWLGATFNFHLTSRYVQGHLNVAADAASRLHLPGYLQVLLQYTAGTPLELHMSPNSFLFLFNRIRGKPSPVLQ